MPALVSPQLTFIFRDYFVSQKIRKSIRITSLRAHARARGVLVSQARTIWIADARGVLALELRPISETELPSARQISLFFGFRGIQSLENHESSFFPPHSRRQCQQAMTRA